MQEFFVNGPESFEIRSQTVKGVSPFFFLASPPKRQPKSLSLSSYNASLAFSIPFSPFAPTLLLGFSLERPFGLGRIYTKSIL
jgi:hypothetical protein